jgi:hypothetical protein
VDVDWEVHECHLRGSSHERRQEECTLSWLGTQFVGSKWLDAVWHVASHKRGVKNVYLDVYQSYMACYGWNRILCGMHWIANGRDLIVEVKRQQLAYVDFCPFRTWFHSLGPPGSYFLLLMWSSLYKGLFTWAKARRMHSILIGCPICRRQVIGRSRNTLLHMREIGRKYTWR